MKTIFLMRHGKSDWKAEYGGDHERPLAKRGVKAATAMGEFLANAGQLPERVLTSSAVRARTTVELAARAGSWSCPIAVAPELYAASVDEVLHRVHQEPEGAESLLLAGHEPTWSMLASELIGGGEVRFPTAAIARIDVAAGTWSEIAPGMGQLVWFVIPRLLT